MERRRMLYSGRLKARREEIIHFLDNETEYFEEEWQETFFMPVLIANYQYGATDTDPAPRQELKPGMMGLYQYWGQNNENTFWMKECRVYCDPGWSIHRELDWYYLYGGHLVLSPGLRRNGIDTVVTVITENALLFEHWETVVTHLRRHFEEMAPGGRPRRWGEYYFYSPEDFRRFISNKIKILYEQGTKTTQAKVIELLDNDPKIEKLADVRTLGRRCHDFGYSWEYLVNYAIEAVVT